MNPPIVSSRKKKNAAKAARARRRYKENRAKGDSSEVAKRGKHTPEECATAAWLKPWHFKPGHAPLPGAGRPKKLPITERLEWAIELLLPEGISKKYGMPKGSTVADLIAYRVAIGAAEGNPKEISALCELIADRIEGKPITRIAGAQGEPIVPPALNVSFVKGKK